MSLKMMPLVLALVFPVLASAQDAQPQRGPGQGRPPRPPSSLELLLEHREELALTPEQVARVTELQQALEEKSAPLKEQLDALRPPHPPGPPPEGAGRASGGSPGGAPPDREAMREKMQQAQPLFEELRANDAAAYEEAEKLLDDSQKTRARELITQAREEHRQRHEARRARMQGGQ